MVELKNSLKTRTLDSLKESLIDGKHYFYLSSTNQDNTLLKDTILEDNTALHDIISAYKIMPNEVEFALKINQWQNGTKYYPYTDSVNLKNKNYYVTVADTAYNHIDVFLCIDNNNTESTEPPYSNTGEEIEFIVTTDGYIWKHLYRLADWTNDPFTTNTHIRINNTQNKSNSQFGGIEKIVITKFGGAFLNSVNLDLDSSFSIVDVDFTDKRLTLGANVQRTGLSTLSGENAIYNNDYMIYLFKSTTHEFIGAYTIENYSYSTNSITLNTCEALNDSPFVLGSIYKILPKIKIQGNGEDLVIMPNINSVTKAIESVEIINPGQGYSNVVLTSINNYEYKPVYSSSGGIGFNILKDLNCSDLIIRKQILCSGKSVYENETGSVFTETLTIGSGPSSLLSGQQNSIVTYIMPTMEDNTIYKFGLIHSEELNNITDPSKEQYTTLSGCDTYTIYQGISYNIPNSLNTVQNFTNNEYICQTDLNGEVIAYGKVISTKYFSYLAEVATGLSPAEYQVVVLKCARPKLVVKMYKGHFSSNFGYLKKYDINNNTVTNTLWKIGANVQADIIKNKGNILYTENSDPIVFSTETSATFKLIISI